MCARLWFGGLVAQHLCHLENIDCESGVVVKDSPLSTDSIQLQ